MACPIPALCWRPSQAISPEQKYPIEVLSLIPGHREYYRAAAYQKEVLDAATKQKVGTGATANLFKGKHGPQAQTPFFGESLAPDLRRILKKTLPKGGRESIRNKLGPSRKNRAFSQRRHEIGACLSGARNDTLSGGCGRSPDLTEEVRSGGAGLPDIGSESARRCRAEALVQALSSPRGAT